MGEIEEGRRRDLGSSHLLWYPSALFKSLIERAQGILDWVTAEFRDLEGIWEGKTIVILVVSNSGGRNVLRIISQLFPKARILWALFSYREYGTAGFKGGLIQNPEVVSRLERLVKRMCSYLKLE